MVRLQRNPGANWRAGSGDAMKWKKKKKKKNAKLYNNGEYNLAECSKIINILEIMANGRSVEAKRLC